MDKVDEEEATHLKAINDILRKRGIHNNDSECAQGWLAKGGSDRTGLWDGFYQTGAKICFFCNKPGYQIAQCNAKAAAS